MTLTNPRSSQINTADIEQTAFASNAQVDTLQSNLTSFASYSNSTFETGSTFTAGVLFDEPIKLIPSENANSAYATSNVISIATPVNSRDNLLVYLDGLLQHPDTYIVNGTTLQFANVEPIPSEVTVGVRYLQTSNLVVDTATANALVGANGMLAWDYESKQLRVYDGSTIGGLYANAVQAPAGYRFQGSVSGYTSGGRNYPFVGLLNVIDKFPFSADSNASDVGDLTQGRYGVGQSSTESGYHSGGWAPGASNTIDKFPFSSDGNATDVGDLTQARYYQSGQSSINNGYTSGGSPPSLNTVDKFPFSSDSNASDVGDLTYGSYEAFGQSSSTSGYNTGGRRPAIAPISNIIEKFPFTTDSNASDVGDLTAGRYSGASQSSSENGYISGGNPVGTNIIEKFSFTSDGNGSDVGDLTQGKWRIGGGQSSTASGYTSGGYVPGGPAYNTIEKFPFSTDSNATDVGDLTGAKFRVSGHQV